MGEETPKQHKSGHKEPKTQSIRVNDPRLTVPECVCGNPPECCGEPTIVRICGQNSKTPLVAYHLCVVCKAFCGYCVKCECSEEPRCPDHDVPCEIKVSTSEKTRCRRFHTCPGCPAFPMKGGYFKWCGEDKQDTAQAKDQDSPSCECKKPVMCPTHNHPCPTLISRSVANPNRTFHVCSICGRSQGRKFFVWCDENSQSSSSSSSFSVSSKPPTNVKCDCEKKVMCPVHNIECPVAVSKSEKNFNKRYHACKLCESGGFLGWCGQKTRTKEKSSIQATLTKRGSNKVYMDALAEFDTDRDDPRISPDSRSSNKRKKNSRCDSDDEAANEDPNPPFRPKKKATTPPSSPERLSAPVSKSRRVRQSSLTISSHARRTNTAKLGEDDYPLPRPNTVAEINFFASDTREEQSGSKEEETILE